MPGTQLPDPQATQMTVPSDLSPAEADSVREAALAALSAAKESQTPFTVSLDGDRATPCAVQLVVAASRSAAAAEVDVVVSAETRKVLADLGLEIGNGD